jgi:hypothetical protein
MAASVSPPRLQVALHALVDAGLETLDRRLQSAVASATGDRFTRLRADGGWSVAQVLEHLVRANEAYLHSMRTVLDGAPRAVISDATSWQPTFLGRQLARSLERTMRLPAPGRSRPGPNVRPDIFERLLDTHREVRSLMQTAGSSEWQQLRMPSPLARWVKLNFGDVCYVILRHGERHAGQIERTLASF